MYCQINLLWLAGCQFTKQRWNSCPLHWKCTVLTTGSIGNSLLFLKITLYFEISLDVQLQKQYIEFSSTLQPASLSIDTLYNRLFWKKQKFNIGTTLLTSVGQTLFRFHQCFQQFSFFLFLDLVHNPTLYLVVISSSSSLVCDSSSFCPCF